MRVYEVHTPRQGVFRIRADEVEEVFDNESLYLYRDEKLVAMFKEWLTLADVTEKGFDEEDIYI